MVNVMKEYGFIVNGVLGFGWFICEWIFILEMLGIGRVLKRLVVNFKFLGWREVNEKVWKTILGRRRVRGGVYKILKEENVFRRRGVKWCVRKWKEVFYLGYEYYWDFEGVFLIEWWSRN